MNTQTFGLQFFNILLQSDLLTKAIFIILACFSIYSWAIIIDKFFKFRLLAAKTLKFEKIFWSGDMLEDIYQKVKNTNKCPSVMVFASAMQEWTNSNVQEIIKNKDTDRKNSLKDRLFDVMTVAANRSLKKIKSGTTFLLIAATTSTFFGLLGTVWGVSQSFKAISIMKDASLMTIAPGISAALSTTIVGLLAAIPALIAYHIISNKIANCEDEINDFVLEVLSVLSRELD